MSQPWSGTVAAVPAIVGVGQTAIGRLPDRSSLALMGEAAQAAAVDAELELSDIDGLITVPARLEGWGTPSAVVCDYLGLDVTFFETLELGGASGVAMLGAAARLVATGECRAVLCVAGQSLLSRRGRGEAIRSMAQSGPLHPHHEVPLGPTIPTMYALAAQRYLFEHGQGPEGLAEIAVQMRSNASKNDLAHRREPLAVDQVLGSRMISSPLRLFDCALVSDGAAAFIVGLAAMARGGAAPVRLLGIGASGGRTYAGEGSGLVETSARESAATAFRRASLGPADVDVAQLYDCFTIAVALQLEDMGFCPRGQALHMVKDIGITTGGGLPVATHGGLLSGGHPGLAGGLLSIVEACRQLRGMAGPRQVERVRVVLVHGAGGMLSINATALLAT